MLVKYIKKYFQKETSINGYEDAFGPVKMKFLGEVYKRSHEDLFILQKMGLLDFYDNYKQYKDEDIGEIFKAGQASILDALGEMAEISDSKVN